MSYLAAAAAAAAKSLQSCLTLCNPIDGSPPSSPVPGILQARILEWGPISFSNAWKWKVKVKSLSSVQLFAIPWTAAHQAPPSMGFSRQEYWSGCHCFLSNTHLLRGIQKRTVGFLRACLLRFCISSKSRWLGEERNPWHPWEGRALHKWWFLSWTPLSFLWCFHQTKVEDKPSNHKNI